MAEVIRCLNDYAFLQAQDLAQDRKLRKGLESQIEKAAEILLDGWLVS